MVYTREEFEAALKAMKQNEEIVRGYLAQLKAAAEDTGPFEAGDFKECVAIHQRNTKGLTIGRKYEIIEVSDTGSPRMGRIFYILDDNKKRRQYAEKNSQFKNLR